MAAVSARAFLTSRVTELSAKPFHHLQQLQQQIPPQPPPPLSHHLLIRPWLPALSLASRRRHSPAISCLISGFDGGGVSDDFVSTRNSGFTREFSVLANMLKRIEPLDTSIISKGISDSAKDSMKQTISTMLGLLPSDQFSVTVRVSKHPLDRLIVSSIITGYTLWNAEYRISLMRNFDIPLDSLNNSSTSEGNGSPREASQGREVSGIEDGRDGCIHDSENTNLECLGELTPEVLNYIHHLEAELSVVKQELHAQKQENMQMECIKRSNNDLLEYLRSLESDMVSELSRPSSPEVEEIICQLAQNILGRFFKEEIADEFEHDLSLGPIENDRNCEDESGTIGASRDYLAKLLFWCMLLGHHLRGLENRLHLSCAVGLL